MGIAAVACALLLVCGLAWYLISSRNDGITSAAALQAAFASNQKRASEMYEGKTITVQGRTKAAIRVPGGDAALLLLTNNEDRCVVFVFSGGSGNELDRSSVPDGTNVIGTGRCTGVNENGHVLLHDAVLVEAAGKLVSASESDEKRAGSAERLTRAEVLKLLQWKGATIGHTGVDDGITKTSIVFQASQEEWRRLLGKEEILSEGYNVSRNMDYSRWRYRCKDGPLTLHGVLLLSPTGGTMSAANACYY